MNWNIGSPCQIGGRGINARVETYDDGVWNAKRWLNIALGDTPGSFLQNFYLHAVLENFFKFMGNGIEGSHGVSFNDQRNYGGIQFSFCRYGCCARCRCSLHRFFRVPFFIKRLNRCADDRNFVPAYDEHWLGRTCFLDWPAQKVLHDARWRNSVASDNK